MNNIIEDYKKANALLNDIHHPKFVAAIKEQLALLEDGEKVPMNSNSCEFDSIPTGNYTDAFNELSKDGKAMIYNNLSCDKGFCAFDIEVYIFDFSIKTLEDVLSCLITYNNNKAAEKRELRESIEIKIDSDFNVTKGDAKNMRTVLNHLDIDSELYDTQMKVMRALGISL